MCARPFLATKSGVGTPGDMLKKVDARLRLGTDYIDLLFFHGLDTKKAGWPKSREMKEAIEKIKKTGKVKFVGFSTHDPAIAEQLQNAAEGGFVDVIMLKFSPWLDKDSPLNKALDACHKANIGLVSMKQIAGQALHITQDKVPSLKERNLSPVQGLLHAIWTDERFSASCVTMRNNDQTLENADAARRFEPLKLAELEELRSAVLAAGPTLCPNCDGRSRWRPAPMRGWATSRGFTPTTKTTASGAMPASATPSSRPRNETGRTLTSRPRTKPVTTRSISRVFYPRSTACSAKTHSRI